MSFRPKKNSETNTSWQPVSEWYHSSVGASGHYYHQHVVIPNLMRLLQLHESASVLDLGCGQGILARQLPEGVYYQGLDLAPSLIQLAKKQNHNPDYHFAVANVTRPLPIQKKDFTHATCVLALQNMDNIEGACQQAFNHLSPGGMFVIVLNHPCFRIPRQSSWETDPIKKTQYRRIDRYFSPLKVPIAAEPSKKNSAVTWSFHYPLSAFTTALSKNGFFIKNIEEWVSDKTSVGKAAKMENRSRAEFPLFLALIAIKL
jgi:SAM-dependent methyltransferase